MIELVWKVHTVHVDHLQSSEGPSLNISITTNGVPVSASKALWFSI